MSWWYVFIITSVHGSLFLFLSSRNGFLTLPRFGLDDSMPVLLRLFVWLFLRLFPDVLFFFSYKISFFFFLCSFHARETDSFCMSGPIWWTRFFFFAGGKSSVIRRQGSLQERDRTKRQTVHEGKTVVCIPSIFFYFFWGGRKSLRPMNQLWMGWFFLPPV